MQPHRSNALEGVIELVKIYSLSLLSTPCNVTNVLVTYSGAQTRGRQYHYTQRSILTNDAPLALYMMPKLAAHVTASPTIVPV